MAGELANNRAHFVARLRVDPGMAAHISQEAYNAIQTERMQLMVERDVIETYNAEQSPAP